MTSEGSGRSEFSKPMSDHFFIHIYTDKLSSVVYCEGVSYKVRNDLCSSIPHFDDLFVSSRFSLLNLLEDLRMNSESFL